MASKNNIFILAVYNHMYREKDVFSIKIIMSRVFNNLTVRNCRKVTVSMCTILNYRLQTELVPYDPLFLAAHLLNLRSFLIMHLQKPKGCQNNHQTLYYNRSTFGANPSAHLKLAPLFMALGGATKSRCFHSSQQAKRAKIGLRPFLDAKTIESRETIDLNKFSAVKSASNDASVYHQSPRSER